MLFLLYFSLLHIRHIYVVAHYYDDQMEIEKPGSKIFILPGKFKF